MSDLLTRAEYGAIADDIDFAAAKAREAFEDGRWSRLRHDQYTELKTIWIDLADKPAENPVGISSWPI